jgi:UDP-N-acetyl-D-glucosamine dehydrogenase
MSGTFTTKLTERTLKVGVIGLGYVGLPLAHVFWRAGFDTIGFDIDTTKVTSLRANETYIRHFPAAMVQEMNVSGRFEPTCDFAKLREADAILICVPTPLTISREPDLQYVVGTTETVAKFLRQEQLVVLESTTYPGTTEEVVRPILERGGLTAGVDFYLAFSPEREDPGSSMETRAIPKVVGGTDARSNMVAAAFYRAAFAQIVEVRDTQTAEAVKITENIFRAVNIALVNELKIAFSRMGVNIWEVIDAAKTKPFGYMAFYPGPGLGGHCIPIDPFYLAWRARAFDVDTKFIELAGEINRSMPRLVVQTLQDALSARFGRALKGAQILIMGVAYKKNVDDLRESPSLRIMDMLQGAGAEIAYCDPHIPQIPRTREHANLTGLRSVGFDGATLSRFDAAVIATDHDDMDYGALVRWAKLVVDTRNATKSVREGRDKIVMA